MWTFWQHPAGVEPRARSNPDTIEERDRGRVARGQGGSRRDHLGLSVVGGGVVTDGTQDDQGTRRDDYRCPGNIDIEALAQC